ncbi:MAG: hypothetical protein QME58_04045, partial [Bacteroidota bacterium]|nr:hypothetical protein [Bacteroidota bacterium]
MKQLNNFIDPRRILRIVIYVCSIIFISCTAFAQVDTLWFENFDDLDTLAWTNRWNVSAGTWEVGIPTSGPGSAYSPQRCAATILAGNYPSNANTRLERIQSFTVPPASQNPRLRFWHWFNTDENYWC